jgi:hypothetical protein
MSRGMTRPDDPELEPEERQPATLAVATATTTRASASL